MIWKLAEAKNKFSEVVRRALSDGPQRIERRDDALYLMSEEEYRRLSGAKPSLVEFLMDGPDWSELELERDHAPMREFDL